MKYSSVVGQEKLKKNLQDITRSDSISHGYIFEGPKGIGKLQLAKAFAQTILCKSNKDIPCGICSSCIKANADSHPDIHILDYEDKSIKRQDIDDIQNIIYVKPYESNKKIIIMNDSQKMTDQAANTFLKTLEEPPEDTIIILITTNSNIIIPTIASRCQIIKFDRVSEKEIENLLVEKYNIETEKAKLLSGYSKGILQRALNIEKNVFKTLELRIDALDIIDDILFKGKSVVFDYEKYFDLNKDNIDEIIEIMMIWFRDVLFFKVGVLGQIINVDKFELLEKHSNKINKNKCAGIYDVFQIAHEDINNNINYKLVIDNLLFKIQEVKYG